MGIVPPIIMAFLRRCSEPLISFFSSGIATNPRSANMITPIGVVRFAGFMVVRLDGLMIVMDFRKRVIMIVIIAMTPHVSIFFSPRNPSFRRSVIVIQKIIPKRIGGVVGEISFDRD